MTKLVRAIGDLAYLFLHQMDSKVSTSEEPIAPYRNVKNSRTYSLLGGAWLQADFLKAMFGDTFRLPLSLGFDLDEITIDFSPPEDGYFISYFRYHLKYDSDDWLPTTGFEVPATRVTIMGTSTGPTIIFELDDDYYNIAQEIAKTRDQLLEFTFAPPPHFSVKHCSAEISKSNHDPGQRSGMINFTTQLWSRLTPTLLNVEPPQLDQLKKAIHTNDLAQVFKALFVDSSPIVDNIHFLNDLYIECPYLNWNILFTQKEHFDDVRSGIAEEDQYNQTHGFLTEAECTNLVLNMKGNGYPSLEYSVFTKEHLKQLQMSIEKRNKENAFAHVQTYSLTDSTQSVSAWWQVNEKNHRLSSPARITDILGDTWRTNAVERDPQILEAKPANVDETPSILTITDLNYGFRSPTSTWGEESDKESSARVAVREWIENAPAIIEKTFQLLNITKSSIENSKLTDKKKVEAKAELEELTKYYRELNEFECNAVVHVCVAIEKIIDKYAAELSELEPRRFEALKEQFQDLKRESKSCRPWEKKKLRPDWLTSFWSLKSDAYIIVNIARTLPVTSDSKSWEIGGLWDTLRHLKTPTQTSDSTEYYLRDRTTVVVSAHLLRASGAHISHRLSWELAAEDCQDALRTNERLKPLLEFGHLVVRFGCSGALIYSNKQKRFQLLYDPIAKDGFFRDSENDGNVLGSNSCLVAAIASALCGKRSVQATQSIVDGAKQGIIAAQLLYETGYGNFLGQSSKYGGNLRQDLILDKGFDYFSPPGSAEELLYYPFPHKHFPTDSSLAKRIVNIGFDGASNWRIVDRFSEEEVVSASVKFVLRENAETDPIMGYEALTFPIGANDLKLPLAQFKGFVAIDRSEIESFRSIRTLLKRYIGSNDPDPEPLSFAVFGPPGSGKSFGVKQMAKSISEKIDFRSYNLAQFSRPEDLVIPLLQARDVSSNEVPLIFFDEFDSSINGRTLGWLRYLLQPMQDGEFKHENEIRKIGKSIFVFAGGTSDSFSRFSRLEASETEVEEFRIAKGPDFVSRLSGYIDTLGVAKEDGYGYLLRRAVLLRSLLKKHELLSQKNESLVDKGFIRRLLKVGSLRHGARSLEKILTMSVGVDGRLRPPSLAQLDVHLSRDDAKMLFQNMSN